MSLTEQYHSELNELTNVYESRRKDMVDLIDKMSIR